MMAGFGERTLEFAGRVVDGVFLHTFFSDAAVTRCVAAVRRGAERAGRDPDRIRIWSVLAVVDGSLDEATLLKKVVGRMGSYLQGYGDLMVGVNGWDPAALERFRADEVVQSIVRTGAIDAIATTDQLRHIEELIPPEWTAPAAVGTPEERAAEIARQFELGVTDVICHGVTPAELPAVLEAYRALRPPRNASRTEVNPGRAP
jgi:alkanesulfonate monooxygenase SsuD/methylene tetrahydromethanopterin reductase-like flavin-dependent oxidoreductase (luciferase family)